MENLKSLLVTPNLDRKFENSSLYIDEEIAMEIGQFRSGHPIVVGNLSFARPSKILCDSIFMALAENLYQRYEIFASLQLDPGQIKLHMYDHHLSKSN